MKPRRIALATLVLAVALALTGCGNPAPHSSGASSASPSASHTSTPTPTPTVAPLVAAQLQLTHDGIVVVSTTNVAIATIPYSTAPETVVSQLGAYIGTTAPIVNHPAGQCTGNYSDANWGSSLEIHWNTDPAERTPSLQWVATSRAATAGTVVVDTAQGFKVGDSSVAYLAGTPGATTPNGYGEIWSELDANNMGVLAIYDNHLVTLLQAPAYVGQDC